MSFDQRARDAAGAVRDDLDAITIPEPTAVVRRARRRRTAGISTTAFVVAVAVIATFVLVRRDDGSPTVNVAGTPSSMPAQAAATTEGLWSTVDKASSGIGAGTSLHALASDGSSFLLAGDRPGESGVVVTAWWSDDGMRWTEADHPREHDSLTAIGTHSGTALAIGAPGGANAFVWRSQDHGRHWDEIARGSLFGQTVANNRPGAFVTALSWHAGWWIASGGAANGYEGIWISRDGAQWELVLDSHSSGSIDAVAETTDGALLAYGVSAVHPPDTIEIGWSTRDPSDWGRPIAIQTPDRFYLQSVNADATLAVGSNLDKYGRPTPVLRSADGGRSWRQVTRFTSHFPDASAWTATTVAGLEVVAGTTTDSKDPKVWLSTGSSAWSEGPRAGAPPTLPSTSIPVVPPKSSLSLVAAVGNRVVFMGIAPELDRYYTFDVGARAAPAPTTARAARP